MPVQRAQGYDAGPRAAQGPGLRDTGQGHGQCGGGQAGLAGRLGRGQDLHDPECHRERACERQGHQEGGQGQGRERRRCRSLGQGLAGCGAGGQVDCEGGEGGVVDGCIVPRSGDGDELGLFGGQAVSAGRQQEGVGVSHAVPGARRHAHALSQGGGARGQGRHLKGIGRAREEGEGEGLAVACARAGAVPFSCQVAGTGTGAIAVARARAGAVAVAGRPEGSHELGRTGQQHQGGERCCCCCCCEPCQPDGYDGQAGGQRDPGGLRRCEEDRRRRREKGRRRSRRGCRRRCGQKRWWQEEEVTRLKPPAAAPVRRAIDVDHK
jgi:hypothetical protein